MTMTLRSRAGRYVRDAALAFERAPVEVAVFVLLAALFSWAVETQGEAYRAWFEMLVACGIVLVAAWTGTLLYATGTITAPQRWLVTLAGGALALLHAVLVPEIDTSGEMWRVALLAGAGVLWLAGLPAIARWPEPRADAVRTIHGRILLRAFGALLYSAALFAGLALALAAVDNLFELDLGGELYAHVFGWLMLVLGPWIVVGGLDDYMRPPGEASAVARVVQRMTGYLVPPLLALYYLILYAYAIRIAVTGEIPKNLVSPMVIAAAILGVLALFLFEPRSAADGGGARYLRWAPPLLLPLIGIGMWTILLRVGQYGWTEFRVLRLVVLLVLGMLAVGATSQLVRRRRFALHLVPLTLAAVLLLGAVGPWSVLAVSRRDQQARLESALREAAATGPLPAPEPRTVPADLYERIRSGSTYLVGHFGIAALPPQLRALVHDRGAVFELPERLGLRREPPPLSGERFVHARVNTGPGIQLGDALVAHRVIVGTPELRAAAAPDVIDGGSSVTGYIEGTRVRMQADGTQLTAELADLIAALREDPTGRGVELPPQNARVALHDASGRDRGTLVVLEIAGRYTDDRFTVNRLEALLLVTR